MVKRNLIKMSLILALVFGLFSAAAVAADEIQPPQIWKPMPDFELPTLDGKTVKLSSLQGKNVMLVFPRGYAAEDHWCNLCNYQYAEFVDYEQMKNLREKYNMEILYVLPYSEKIAKDWLAQFPGQLEAFENWKHPKPEKEGGELTEQQKKWSVILKKEYPKKYEYTSGNIPTPFPILIDADRKVSKGLDLFREEWGKRKVDQNIPAIYVLDKKGIVQFKYVSQNTFDRPDPAYLDKILGTLLK